MAYRDDVSALRARCDALEREVEQSHRELARLLEAAAERERLEGRAEALQAQLDELREQIRWSSVDAAPAPSPRPRSPALMAATMAALVGGCVLHLFAAEHERQLSAYRRSRFAERAQTVEEQRALDALRHAVGGLVEGKAGPRGAPLFDPEARPGQVVRASGETQVARGDRCTVELVPVFGLHDFNCRAEVSCGGALLYGGQGLGYMTCAFEGRRATFAQDSAVTRDDGDPQLTLDLVRDRAYVADGSRAELSVEIALDGR